MTPRQAQSEIDRLVSKYKPFWLSTPDWIDSLAPTTFKEASVGIAGATTITYHQRGSAVYSRDPLTYERNQLIYEIYKSLER